MKTAAKANWLNQRLFENGQKCCGFLWVFEGLPLSPPIHICRFSKDFSLSTQTRLLFANPSLR